MPDDVLPIADKVLTPITALGLAVARVGAHIIPARRGERDSFPATTCSSSSHRWSASWLSPSSPPRPPFHLLR